MKTLYLRDYIPKSRSVAFSGEKATAAKTVNRPLLLTGVTPSGIAAGCSNGEVIMRSLIVDLIHSLASSIPSPLGMLT